MTYTQDQQAILDYIQQHNDELIAWKAEAPEHRWIGLLTQDLEYWADHDVHTVEDLQRTLLISEISDNYKDVYGFRPRPNWNQITLDHLKSWASELEECSRVAFELEEAARIREEALAKGEPDPEIPTSWDDGNISVSLSFNLQHA